MSCVVTRGCRWPPLALNAKFRKGLATVHCSAKCSRQWRLQGVEERELVMLPQSLFESIQHPSRQGPGSLYLGDWSPDQGSISQVRVACPLNRVDELRSQGPYPLSASSNPHWAARLSPLRARASSPSFFPFPPSPPPGQTSYPYWVVSTGQRTRSPSNLSPSRPGSVAPASLHCSSRVIGSLQPDDPVRVADLLRPNPPLG